MANESTSCRCPHCGTKIRIKPEYVGRRARCPQQDCRRSFVVVADEVASSAPAERPPAPNRNRSELPITNNAPPVTRTAKKASTGRPKKPTSSPRSHRNLLVIAAIAVIAVGAGFAMTGRGEVEAKTSNPLASTTTIPVSVEPAKPQRASFADAIGQFVTSNCVECHSGEAPEGDLDLGSDKTTEDVLANRARWVKAYDMIRIGAMPPPDYAMPPEAEMKAVANWLDETLFHVDCEAGPDPGRVTVRRLNKVEYTNTVRDLLGIDFDPAKGFPSDEVGYGFDNIGDVLTVPPLLMEKYLDAAEQIANKAILVGDPDLIRNTFDASKLKTSGGAYPDKGNGRITMASGGNTAKAADVKIPRKAEYVIRVDAGGDQAGDEPVRISVKVGGKEVAQHEVKAKTGSPQEYDIRRTMDPGKASIEVTFLNDYYKEGVGDRNAFVYGVSLIGPYGIDEGNLPKSHQQLTHVRPGKDKSLATAALENLRPFVRRAFRRDVSDAELAPFTRFAELASERGDSFEQSMQVALQAVLVSPRFLFRIEEDDGSTGKLARRLNAFETASRLSYFLWNSTPDDELLNLASDGQLLRTDVLQQQIDRLLTDERSDEMIGNFAGQWLGLRRLSEMTPDEKVFPSYSVELRRDMEAETYALVRNVLRSNARITELISAKYTFLNERLAKHYGFNDVKGDELQRFDLPGNQRAGLLTHASILMLTSYPNRTSPVRRGEWILTNILGDEPPPAPPNVPTLEETQASTEGMTLRQQMAKHREDPSCAACHKTMDAIGFGFESYDAIGRWREKDGEHPVDASGQLPSGETFSGATDLVQILSERQSEFVETFTERLLTFALGRGIEYTDRCVLDSIVERAESEGATFKAIVKAIVLSDAFRYQGGQL